MFLLGIDTNSLTQKTSELGGLSIVFTRRLSELRLARRLG
jgi:hypothetical protein